MKTNRTAQFIGAVVLLTIGFCPMIWHLEEYAQGATRRPLYIQEGEPYPWNVEHQDVGGSGSQTPLTNNVDAATHSVTNAGTVALTNEFQAHAPGGEVALRVMARKSVGASIELLDNLAFNIDAVANPHYAIVGLETNGEAATAYDFLLLSPYSRNRIWTDVTTSSGLTFSNSVIIRHDPDTDGSVNVGIGRFPSGSALDVRGTAKMDALRIAGGATNGAQLACANATTGAAKWSGPSAFLTAFTNSNFKWTNNTQRTISFDPANSITEHNYGNDWDGTNYVCPVNGFYSFTGQFYVQGTGQNWLYMLTNGANAAMAQVADSATAGQECGLIQVTHCYFTNGTVISFGVQYGSSPITNVFYGEYPRKSSFLCGGLDQEIP